jgi:hypothetical protein
LSSAAAVPLSQSRVRGETAGITSKSQRALMQLSIDNNSKTTVALDIRTRRFIIYTIK